MANYTASTKSPLAFKRMERIQDILEEGPKTGSEILQEVSFNRMALNAYLRKLLDDGDVVVASHDGHGSQMYGLPTKDSRPIRFNKPAPIVVQRDWAVAALFGST